MFAGKWREPGDPHPLVGFACILFTSILLQAYIFVQSVGGIKSLLSGMELIQ